MHDRRTERSGEEGRESGRRRGLKHDRRTRRGGWRRTGVEGRGREAGSEAGHVVSV